MLLAGEVSTICLFVIGLTYILIARSLQRGEEARQVLESEGLHPSVLHLDVDSQQSIQQARDLVKQKYGRLDVLVNNAGVLFRVCKENWGCRWNWGKSCCGLHKLLLYKH